MSAAIVGIVLVVLGLATSHQETAVAGAVVACFGVGWLIRDVNAR